MKRMMQFRFENNNNENNYPQFVDYIGKLTLDNIFKGYNSITQLGIQGPPGLIFYLNGGNNPITIGKTGIYELDLGNIGKINRIQFNANSLSALVEQTSNRLIIDIIYEGG